MMGSRIASEWLRGRRGAVDGSVVGYVGHNIRTSLVVRRTDVRRRPP